MEWIQHNWLEIVGIVWAFDQFLKVIAKVTPWGWDDNLSDILGSLLKNFFPKGK